MRTQKKVSDPFGAPVYGRRIVGVCRHSKVLNSGAKQRCKFYWNTKTKQYNMAKKRKTFI